jgi:hypothetical protein
MIAIEARFRIVEEENGVGDGDGGWMEKGMREGGER